MAHQIQKVTLEKIAKEKLSKQLTKDIDSIEIEVWENVEPRLFLEISKRTISLRLNYIGSTKKFLAWCGGIVATIGGVVTVLKWLVPIFVAYLTHPMP